MHKKPAADINLPLAPCESTRIAPPLLPRDLRNEANGATISL
jgi:hypothetical protein